VTLDDADISQYQYAFPVLKKQHIPFLLFVISGRVGEQNFNAMEMATWPQIREMVLSELVTIGSHTHDMHELESSSRQPPFMLPDNAGKFAGDLQTSLSTIQRELGTPVRYFAYPYGFGTPQTDGLTLKAGIHLIFSLREGLARSGDPSFFVKRVMVTPRNWPIIEQWLAMNSGV
jgi:poly-beta-1,6-N-acetyl-D-glucosamine N-deacetylase